VGKGLIGQMGKLSVEYLFKVPRIRHAIVGDERLLYKSSSVQVRTERVLCSRSKSLLYNVIRFGELPKLLHLSLLYIIWEPVKQHATPYPNSTLHCTLLRSRGQFLFIGK
jgi:hypothetical protein